MRGMVMEYIRNNGVKVIVQGNKVQYGEGKMKTNIIGANFIHGAIFSGYLSSFNGTFDDELIGIESGLGDIVNVTELPCSTFCGLLGLDVPPVTVTLTLYVFFVSVNAHVSAFVTLFSVIVLLFLSTLACIFISVHVIVALSALYPFFTV